MCCRSPSIPHQEPYPGAAKLTDGWGCSAQGLGVANYGGMEKTYMVGDWCSGRVWGIAWDKGANKWQMQELMQATLQFTAGNDRREWPRSRNELLLLLP